jgi:nucleoid-associated protein YgaU
VAGGGCPVSVLLRTPGDAPARATVELALTAVSDVVASVGPLSGGAKRPRRKEHWTTAPVHGGGGGRPHPGAPKSYVVRQGDTLPAIAGRVYGEPDDWHRIADANGIRDPRHLKVGRKLRIP